MMIGIRPAGEHSFLYISNGRIPIELYRLPLGFAGILAGCFGVAGAVVGMSEVWYTGPLGMKAGAEFGADLGFEVGFCCCLLATMITMLSMPLLQ